MKISRTFSPSSSSSPSASSSRGSLVVLAAKGKNARLAGRDKKSQQREDAKQIEGQEAAAAARKGKGEKASKASSPPRVANVKYSKRGVPSSQTGGQISKAALKRVREATTEKIAEDATKRDAKREEYRSAQAKGIPQVVTDRMLKRISIFSGVPLLLGFSTGPIFYGAKVFAHLDVAPWQFFLASTLTFGGALVGITYGVLSASWEPGREGTFWGGAEIKVNVPILMATVLGKASGELAKGEFPDEWDDGEP